MTIKVTGKDTPLEERVNHYDDYTLEISIKHIERIDLEVFKAMLEHFVSYVDKNEERFIVPEITKRLPMALLKEYSKNCCPL